MVSTRREKKRGSEMQERGNGRENKDVTENKYERREMLAYLRLSAAMHSKVSHLKMPEKLGNDGHKGK